MKNALSLWKNWRTFFVRISAACAALASAFVLTVGTTSCSRDEQSSQSNTNAPAVSLKEFERIAYWNTVLNEHPDLPQKVKEIVDGKGTRVERPATATPVSELIVYSYLGPIAVTAERVNVIVTDLDTLSLTKLLAYWQTIPERARQLGILPSPSTPQGPRVIVLGSEGRIDVKGPGGSDSQTVDIYHDTLASKSGIDVHSFGNQGETIVNALLEYYGRANQSRGPPESNPETKKFELPPSEIATVLVIGKLRTLNVEGGAQASDQRVSFEGYMNGFAETETTRKANEYAKAGDAAFTTGFNAERASRPAERPNETYRPTEPSRPTEPYRPAEPYRPGGGGYHPAPRPMPRPGR